MATPAQMGVVPEGAGPLAGRLVPLAAIKQPPVTATEHWCELPDVWGNTWRVLLEPYDFSRQLSPDGMKRNDELQPEAESLFDTVSRQVMAANNWTAPEGSWGPVDAAGEGLDFVTWNAQRAFEGKRPHATELLDLSEGGPWVDGLVFDLSPLGYATDYWQGWFVAVGNEWTRTAYLKRVVGLDLGKLRWEVVIACIKGVIAGLVQGAAVGAVAGPYGAIVGAIIGAVAGGVAGVVGKLNELSDLGRGIGNQLAQGNADPGSIAITKGGAGAGRAPPSRRDGAPSSPAPRGPAPSSPAPSSPDTSSHTGLLLLAAAGLLLLVD